MKTLYCCAFFILMSLPVRAAPTLALLFDHFHPEKGNPNPIDTLSQDTDGFLWIGSKGQIFRFDGHVFTPFSLPGGDNLSPVRTILTDTTGNVWVATADSIALMRASEERFFNTDVSFKDSVNILRLMMDSQGHLLLATTGGLYRLSFDDDMRHIRPTLLFKQQGTTQVIRTDTNQYWLSTQHQVTRIDIATGNSTPILNLSAAANHSQITTMFATRLSQIWIATQRDGLYRFDNDAQTRTHLSPTDFPWLSTLHVQYLTDDLKGRLWLGTSDGAVFILTHQSDYVGRRLDLGHRQAKTGLSALYTGRQGKVWVAFSDGELDRYRPITEQFLNLSGRQSNGLKLLAANAWALMIDKQQRLWVAVPGKGVNVVDFSERKVHEITSTQGLVGDYPLSFAQDNDGTVWIGTEAGVNQVDNRTLTILRHYGTANSQLSQNVAFPLYFRSRGMLWIGHPRNGFSQFNTLTGAATYHSNEAITVSDQIHEFFSDSQNNAWLVSRNGLALYDETSNKVTPYKMMKSHQKNPSFGHFLVANIEDGFLDSNAVIWLSTADGVRFFDTRTRRYVSHPLPKRLLDRSAFSTIEDKHHDFWVSTIDGLVRFSPKTKEEVLFTSIDGVQGQEFARGVVGRFTDGRLAFGGGEGVTVFSPEALKADESAIRITQIDRKRANTDTRYRHHIPGSLELSRDLKNLTVRFSAMNLAHSDNTRYQYRILGVSEQWKDTPNQVVIDRLKPGDYALQLRASNSFGLYKSPPVTLPMTFLPPWYQGRQAWMLYAILMISLGIALQYTRTRSERKRSQQLEALVEQRTTELVESNRQIRQQADALIKTSEEKSQLFECISHELRTPITLILGPIVQLKHQLAAAGSGQSGPHKLIDMVERNAKRLEQLISQVLALTIAQSQAEQSSQSTDMQALTLNLIKRFKPYASSEGIRLECRAQESLWVALSFDNAEKLLSNLLSNAIKYSNPGDCTTVTLTTDGNMATLTVSDTGIGIQKHQLEAIFERYYRVDSRQVKSEPGSGIGLATVKRLVTEASGHIEAKSEPGKGSTFIVRLPLIEPPAVEDKTGSDDGYLPDFLFTTDTMPGIAVQSPHLLLVDDNEDLLIFITSLLSGHYTVTTARSGAQGYELARSLIPDIILSDIMMPKTCGLTMLQRLKSDELTCHIPVVLLTARGSEQSRIEGLALCADDYITKPFREQELLLRLRNQLLGREAVRRKYAADSARTTAAEDKPTFLLKVDKVLEQHYRDGEFGVAELAREVSLCERQLLRKLKAITDFGPKEYIRVYRLQQAAKRLQQGKSVSYTAFDVGFSSVGYFRTCFRNFYHMQPSKYAERQKADCQDL